LINEDILVECFRRSSSFSNQRISPLTIKYEPPQLSLLCTFFFAGVGYPPGARALLPPVPAHPREALFSPPQVSYPVRPGFPGRRSGSEQAARVLSRFARFIQPVSPLAGGAGG